MKKPFYDECRSVVRSSSLTSHEELLDADAAAIHLDVSYDHLSGLVTSGALLSIKLDDTVKLPAWQFRYDGQLYEEMTTLLHSFEGDMHGLYQFMHLPLEERAGRTPIEIMHVSKEPMLAESGKAYLLGRRTL